MKNLFSRVISMVIIIAMVSSFGITASAKEYPDAGYWANEAIDAAVANGLLHGRENGKIDSEANLTRAEMAAVMVRAFGATIKADVSRFSDLDPSAWYYDDFAKAVQMRVFQGDDTGRMRPNDYITREEVFAVVSRALVLNTSDYSALNKFKDKDKIGTWAKGYISIMAAKSYVNGDNFNNVNPKKNITRAEFAQLMHNIFRNYYAKSAAYAGGNDSHSSMINVGNVTLKNFTVNGDLVIGDGDAKGTIRLEDVVINGRLLVRGSERVELVRTTVGEMVVVNNYNSVVHFDNYKTEEVFKGIVENTKATFKKNSGGSSSRTYYHITFDVDGGSSIPQDKVYKNTDYVLPDADSTKKEGYNLKGWIVEGTEYAPGATVSGISADITIKAVWELATYVITYNVDGGTPITSTTVTYGQELTLPVLGATTKEGCTLKGWLVNGTEYAPGAKVSGIKADTVIKALWDGNVYNVTFDTDGGTAVTATTVKHGEELTLPEADSTTKTGYKLAGWTVNGIKYAPGSKVSGIKADTIIKAVWENETYTITFNTDGGSAIANGTAKYGEAFVLPGSNSTSKAGYYLKGWLVNGTEYDPGDKVSGINADTTIKAVWKAITPDTKFGSYKIEYYKQDENLEYKHISGDDETASNIVVGNYTITPKADKYTGFDLSANSVSITMEIKENKTTVFKVYYDRETYTVTYNTDGGSAVANGKAYYGIDFKLPAAGATTRKGWKFKGWNVNGVIYNSGALVSGIVADTTIKATWERETYTVTFDTNGGSPIANGTATYGYGFTLPDANSTAKDGHSLKGWIVNGTEYAPGVTVSGISSNVTIKAVWSTDEYTITYDVDGGSAIAPATVKYGETLTLPAANATTKTGWKLEGWNVNGTKYAPGASVTGITASTTIKAVWGRETYTVTFDTDGGTPVANGTAKYGEAFVLPGSNSTTKDGFYLKGWIVDGTEYAPGTSVTGITAATTIKAVWEAVTPDTKYGSYTIKYYKQNTSLEYEHISGDDETVNNIVVGNFAITPDADKYKGFDLNANSVSITKPIKENENTVFEVYYDRETYTVTFDTDGGSDVADGTAYYGIDFVLPDDDATTKTGWKFKGWIVNGTQYNAGATVSITEDTVVKAVWERETYTITFDTDGGSPIANGTATYGYGFTLPDANATTKAGHTLKFWIVNGREYMPGTTVSGITADTTIKAVWETDAYEITYDVDGGTAIAPGTVEYGKTLTLPAADATTKTGYVLTGWNVNGTVYTPGATVSGITADTIVKAVWNIEVYNVTYDVDGGSAIPATTVKHGEALVLPASNSTVKDGWNLVGWTVNGTNYTPGATVYGITTDVVIKALWEVVVPGTKYGSYTIKYYKQNTTLDGYEYVSADDVTVNNIVVGDFTITPDADKYEGFDINANSVSITDKIEENKTTVFEVYYDRESYTVTYDVDGGTAVANGTAYYGVDFILPDANASTKDESILKGWFVDGTEYVPGSAVSGITADTTVKAVWEAVAPTVKYGSYVIKYYKQNATGEYDYVAGDDETGNVEVGSVTIRPLADKYVGYVLNANNVYTMDVEEGKTTEFKVYYDLKTPGVEYNKVTFYYRTNVVGSAEVEDGTTVSEAEFPDYGRTYSDGHVKDTTVASVYTTPYQHTVNYGWWYNVEEEKWEEFTTETVVNNDIDVYLKIQKFNAILTLGSGEQFNFYAFYESGTRFTDTVKDVIYKGGPLEALKVAGYWDDVKENGIVQKVLDEDDNIRMISYMIRFSQIIGEENMESFIVDNAKEMFASGNNELLHDAFVEYIIAVSNSTNPDEKKKVHDLMEETIDHIFEEDEISAETLALIEDLCNDALSDSTTFEEVTGLKYSELSKDTKTFAVDYIVNELVNNDKLFAEVVKEVTGVTYTDTTTTKELIIAMAEKQLEDNFEETLDDIKDTQKDLIVETAEDMLTDSNSGLYEEVLSYAKENEKDVIIDTIETLLKDEPALYNEVIELMASEKEYRAMVAQAIGAELNSDDALFEEVTGYKPSMVSNKGDFINILVNDITNNKAKFEEVISKVEDAGKKSFVIDSIVERISADENEDLFNQVVDYAKDDYKNEIVDVIVSELEEDNSPMYEEVIELAKTDDYKQTISNAIIAEMEGTDGDSMIIAITGCTATELAKDPQAKDGFIIKKAEELLDDATYFNSVVDSVMGVENYVLPATPKEFIVDLVVNELMDTESESATRDLIIEEAIAYLLEGEDEEDIEHIADYAIEYLANHPEERDEMVDLIINDVYRDELDKLVYQLINDEQFEVHADTVFVAEGIKNVLLTDYNYETFFGSKIPDSLDKVFEIYPEEKLIELYDFALNSLVEQIDEAIEVALAGGVGHIDCGITPVVNVIADMYVPLYESFKEILEDKTSDIYYYTENIYLQELVSLLDPEVWVQGSPSVKPSDVTGYKIYDLDYYYDLYYKIYVLNDDAIMWYYENLVEAKYEAVTERYKELVLKYANVMADKIDAYITDGTLPIENEKLSAAEKSLKASYPELVDSMIAQYKSYDLYNKDYTEADYDKVCDKIHEVFYRTLYFTTDEYFDILLDQSAYDKIEDLVKDKLGDMLDGKLDGEYYTKVDDNTYELEVNGYKIRFIRELKNTLY